MKNYNKPVVKMTQPNTTENSTLVDGRYMILEVISTQGPNDSCPPTPYRPKGTNTGTNTGTPPGQLFLGLK